MVLGRRHSGLPHLALLDLAVAQQGVYTVILLISLARQSHAHSGGDALAQGAGGHIHALDVAHLGMAGHFTLNGAEQLQILHGEKALQSQVGIERGGTVPLGQHEAVPVGVPGIGGINPHHMTVQGGNDVHGGQGAADVAGGRVVHHVHRQQAGTGGCDSQFVDL